MNKFLILLSVLSFVMISPTKLDFWHLFGNKIEPTSVLRVEWSIKSPMNFHQIQLGHRTDCVEVQNQHALIRNCDDNSQGSYWESGKNWEVKEAIAADLNHDGQKELVMVVWRPFKAWPIDAFLPKGGRINNFHDRQNRSCHLILVGWDGEKYRELWAGSSLADPIFEIQTSDLDGDGLEELAALEGRYDSRTKSGYLTVWEWNGFGFNLVDRSNTRSSKLRVIESAQGYYLLSY